MQPPMPAIALMMTDTMESLKASLAFGELHQRGMTT